MQTVQESQKWLEQLNAAKSSVAYLEEQTTNKDVLEIEQASQGRVQVIAQHPTSGPAVADACHVNSSEPQPTPTKREAGQHFEAQRKPRECDS